MRLPKNILYLFKKHAVNDREGLQAGQEAVDLQAARSRILSHKEDYHEWQRII